MSMISITQSCGEEASFVELPALPLVGSHLVRILSALGFASFSPIDRLEVVDERIR